MSKLFTLSLLAFLFFSYGNCQALEWKELHEQADTRAFQEAEQAVKNKPGSIEELYVLGLVCLNEHKDARAGEAFNKILVLDPGVNEAKWGLAEVIRRGHDTEKSEKLLEEVMNTDPQFYPAYITLAYIRYIQMRFDDAVRLATVVLKAGSSKVDISNHTRAHLLRGGTKGMIAHYGGALSKVINGTAVLPNLKEAQKLQPDSAGVKFGLGSFYLLAPPLAGGDLLKAEEYLKQAVEIDPLFADAYVRLGQLYKLKKNDKEYRNCIDRALKIDPKNELALDISSGKCRFICLDE